MFERFTERARQVVVLAQDEARTLGHNYIGTEHILLGLLREEHGLAARVLASLDITSEEIRARVARIIGLGDEVITGPMPFTPRAKHVLELALREALALGHAHIGTEHILLGLVREPDGVAARMLVDLRADAETIREEVFRALGHPDVPPVRHPVPREGGERASRRGRGAPGDQAASDQLRFTRGARAVLALAQDEARALGHVHMGTEHILLGLLREERGLAARLLGALGFRLADVRAEVVRSEGPSSEPATGHIRFTPQVRQVLEGARSEARALDGDCVGTEHLLLGLMRQDGGIAVRILRGHRS